MYENTLFRAFPYVKCESFVLVLLCGTIVRQYKQIPANTVAEGFKSVGLDRSRTVTVG
jgi:hypothetical protein